MVLQHEAGGGVMAADLGTSAPARAACPGGHGKVESGGPLLLSAEADEGSRRSSCPSVGTTAARKAANSPWSEAWKDRMAAGTTATSTIGY